MSPVGASVPEPSYQPRLHGLPDAVLAAELARRRGDADVSLAEPPSVAVSRLEEMAAAGELPMPPEVNLVMEQLDMPAEARPHARRALAVLAGLYTRADIRRGETVVLGERESRLPALPGSGGD